jgi:flagellar biosynthesis GTPase FlhF
MVAVKKQIQGEGITAFEQDPRYKKVTQCRTNIDEIFDEEKCRNLNKKPSYNSYSNYNSSSFFGAHRYDPNLEINKHIELNIMNALKDNFSYPYTGLRLQYDPKDIHSYPRFTVNRFVLEMVRNNIHKYEIADRCVKKFIKIYETDAENAAKQAAKDAENAAAKAAKDAEKAAQEAAKAAQEAAKAAEKATKNTEKKTEKAAKQAAEKAMKERLREREKEEKAAAKAEKKAQKTKQNKTKKTPPKEPSPKIPSPNPNEKRKRCPNGTRKNKKTGSCEKYNK